MTCKAIREGDEFSCAACGVRWSVDDSDRVKCLGAAVPRVDVLAVTVALAQAMNGPHDDRWVGREKLLELRQHKWNKVLRDQDRRAAFVAIKAVVAELRLMPRAEVLALLDSKD